MWAFSLSYSKGARVMHEPIRLGYMPLNTVNHRELSHQSFWIIYTQSDRVCQSSIMQFSLPWLVMVAVMSQNQAPVQQHSNLWQMWIFWQNLCLLIDNYWYFNTLPCHKPMARRLHNWMIFKGFPSNFIPCHFTRVIVGCRPWIQNVGINSSSHSSLTRHTKNLNGCAHCKAVVLIWCESSL